ncbi:LysR family transcriptional regulator [Amycolatopsis sp. CA-230715]|uniref:LysR family transcriptional regulator n=1 Tax=Amycolatopsis sp. CA-230715 TaxID=2745196 RepID=UPI001C01464D|nr:LysR family transcriptional regulator [Amycolatopsis sp. CA-230715]
MNFEGVRAFVAVAEEGQFRLAADRVGISQQAVSKRIAALEGDLGTALFVRVATGAALTADGRTFLPRARAVLAAVEDAIGSVRPETRPLRVDVRHRRVCTADIVREFRRVHHDLPVEAVTLKNADEMTRALRDGEIDAGFAYLREPVGAGLAHAFAYLDPVQIVVGNRHPLAAATSVRMSELAPFRIWMPGIVGGSEWADFYRELSEDFGVTVDATGPDFGIEALLDTVAESTSTLTFVGDRTSIVWPEDHDLRRIPVRGPMPYYPHSLVWRTGDQHRGLPELIAHLGEVFHPPSDDSWLPRAARTAYRHRR